METAWQLLATDARLCNTLSLLRLLLLGFSGCLDVFITAEGRGVLRGVSVV